MDETPEEIGSNVAEELFDYISGSANSSDEAMQIIESIIDSFAIRLRGADWPSLIGRKPNYTKALGLDEE